MSGNVVMHHFDFPLLERIDFGKTGLKVSRLSFGTGTNGWGGRSSQSRLGVNGLADLLQMAYDQGVNFWDTADDYGTHPHIARALKSIPRDRIVIVTKTMSRTASRVSQDVDRFLKELDIDVLDILLLHVMTQADWPGHYAGVMDALTRAKEKGKVRALGVSCHSLKALQAAAESDWAEVVLVRINYAGTDMDASPQRVVPILSQLFTSGKAVYGMKVLGCGHLVRDVHAAIQYVFQLKVVHAITIGMTRPEQLMENIRLVKELSPQFPLQEVL